MQIPSLFIHCEFNYNSMLQIVEAINKFLFYIISSNNKPSMNFGQLGQRHTLHAQTMRWLVPKEYAKTIFYSVE